MISGAPDHAFWVLVKHFSVNKVTKWAASEIRRKIGLVVYMLCESQLVSSSYCVSYVVN